MRQPVKYNCRLVAQALVAYGVRHVVVSPGSRNAPLVMAVTRAGALKPVSVIDERSAAFVALGLAGVTGAPVAMVCTSGSAMLNYSPALAEAYYRKLPLMAVTADRPGVWIGQDDSQTIRQPGALANVVIDQCSLPVLGDTVEPSDDSNALARRDAVRTLNRVLTAAVTHRQGPVHINIEIDEPLGLETSIDENIREFQKIDTVYPDPKISVATARMLANELSGRRVLVFGGFHAPDARLSAALNRLAALPSVVVVAEALANVHGAGIMQFTDGMMKRGPERPDVLITFGGAPVSRNFKEYVRRGDLAHWHVGANDAIIDMSLNLTRRIEMHASDFFGRFAGAMCHGANGARSESFKQSWQSAAENHRSDVAGYDRWPWCGLSAIGALIDLLPDTANIQLGNGLGVRHAQVFDLCRFHRVDSNRGVSGIDGCLSTAVGAALVYKAGPTVAVIGDMSALYDMGALATVRLCDNLKIVVVNNNGGQIFRTIKATRDIPEMEEFLACRVPDYLRSTASGFNIPYMTVTDRDTLQKARELLDTPGNCIIEIFTGAGTDDYGRCGL